MIVDCFTFYNEFDMLECRLKYLNDKVDKFVLVESNITFNGSKKPMYFSENKERYKEYLDKIIYVPQYFDPEAYDWNFNLSNENQNGCWQIENQQRNCIVNGLTDIPDDAIIMISDLDEIPNKDAIDRAIKLLQNRSYVVMGCMQLFYNLNNDSGEIWNATILVTRKILRQVTPQRFRNGKDVGLKVIKGGWHLTYFMSPEMIANKIKNFAHQEYNTSHFTDIDKIKRRLQNRQDVFDRVFFRDIDVSIFPKDFLDCFNRFLPKQKKMNFVQVGAGAGDLDARQNYRDGFTEYVKSLDKNLIGKIILVEPNPINIPNLQKCWQDYPQAIIINAGVCTSQATDRNITFYYTEEDAPHFNVFSMSPDHIRKHYPTEVMKTLQVNCKTLNEILMATLGNDKIDLLSLDIEGIDAEVILDFDWKKINCEHLSFEYLHLGNQSQNVVNFLNNNGYEFIGNGIDHLGFDWMFKKTN